MKQAQSIFYILNCKFADLTLFEMEKTTSTRRVNWQLNRFILKLMIIALYKLVICISSSSLTFTHIE